ncbi:hypothetical protein H0H93_007919 [Arthromyces matolae]|nr:hypothetical protein H0H93_007919 [Arthromyces matolae]
MTSTSPMRANSMFASTNSFQKANRPPRQAMTAREEHAFNELFSLIFDAADEQENRSSHNDTVIGLGKNGIDDLIGKLRKYPKRLKWSTDMDETLDRQKETINLFMNDQDLLEWARDNVFAESERFEAAARKAISEAATSGVKDNLPMLQPPTYPHLVALIMKTFREKFNDPHLALSIFEHARNLSIASYVFGCSHLAYHELIETRWKCFQDLKGVLEALQEMQLNGVRPSGQTRRLVEKLRRDIGARHLWVEESEIGAGEIWNILSQIEKLALTGFKTNRWDEWKAEMKDKEGDEWHFDDWDKPNPRRMSEGKSRRLRQSGFEEDTVLFDQHNTSTVGVAHQNELQGRIKEDDDGSPRNVPRNSRSERSGLNEERVSFNLGRSDSMDDWGFGEKPKRSLDGKNGRTQNGSKMFGNDDDWGLGPLDNKGSTADWGYYGSGENDLRRMKRSDRHSEIRRSAFRGERESSAFGPIDGMDDWGLVNDAREGSQGNNGRNQSRSRRSGLQDFDDWDLEFLDATTDKVTSSNTSEPSKAEWRTSGDGEFPSLSPKEGWSHGNHEESLLDTHTAEERTEWGHDTVDMNEPLRRGRRPPRRR